MPAWGSLVAGGVGVGCGAAFVGVALAAARLGDGAAFGGEAPAAFAGSGALEAIGIGWPASIASIIEFSLDWSVLTFWAAETMRRALLDLADRCHGDDRPDCPIIDTLEGSGRPAAASYFTVADDQ